MTATHAAKPDGNAGTAPYWRAIDPATGAYGYLRAVPASDPTSEARFARGRPLPPTIQPVPPSAAKPKETAACRCS